MNEILKAIAADTNVSAEFRAALPVGHTPGPWHALANGEGLPLTRIDHDVLGRGRGYNSQCIALLAGTRPNEETTANARLIAAAPAMYEALLKISQMYPSDMESSRVASAALKAATGEA